MDITRTIQKEESEEWVDALFDGTLTETDFPLHAVPKDVAPGDWLYVIYRGKIVGRCRSSSIVRADEPVWVGSDEHVVDARCVITVECPGERAPVEIRRKGHQFIRYDTVPEWPKQ